MAKRKVTQQRASAGNSGKQAAAPSEVERVGAVTQSVIAHAFEKLKQSRIQDPPLFFPNGIELIDVSVSAGMAGKGIEVKVKIAGQKGINGVFMDDDGEGVWADAIPMEPA